ncbi:MAG: restriction endonuclease [Dehalococcoidia bacterium]|nr:restriction endonuclease [Dehalococcoidia bacterium]
MPGPQFVRYFSPLVSALQELGNSGTPAEIRALIAKRMALPDAIFDEQMASGSPRFANQVAWARFYLSKAGYIDSSKRGIWMLAEKGMDAKLAEADALAIFQEVHQSFLGKETDAAFEKGVAEEDSPAPPESGIAPSLDHRAVLLGVLRNLPPSGFEKLCQLLLREAGFQKVEITGRSGDGGIDGKGILQVNSLLSFHVIFQCKRYSGTVGAPQIRDFRGAMAGRTDKGIYITTGSFTIEALREAARDGVTPIELVDADKLVEMFEKLELGLVPRTVYEIDHKFFKEFS